MVTPGSWTTNDLIQKWFIWLNLHTLHTILLDEVDKNIIISCYDYFNHSCIS